MRSAFILAVAALSLAGCNRNTALGNDREAQLDHVPKPAKIESATAALENVSTAIIKPETMSDADIEALGGKRGRCAVVLTEVAFPSFLYEPGGSGAIKLNGKLIPLPSAGENRFADNGLSVTLRRLAVKGNAGSQGMEMVVVPPGAKDEIGYHGYVRCYGGVKT
ncbi:DUF6692 family protein [Novosphingobium malaysiense]|uniref:DUF6692 domain-containing protein n=1 Tax=Novosphingobium malaysiense TaxID=1348853 RepID=A0A0B1ZMX1_9SPHN|nr:DUF6692 family protein [Novosphingobium malaysiense]KHK90615.1 hypothetical protein LK12_14885 [Novosphingobium malaysiense]